MALALRACIPAKLEKAALALGLTHKKDMEGARMLRLFSVPDTLTDARTLPVDEPVKFAKLLHYCAQDVRVERAVLDKLRPLVFTGALLKGWKNSLRINVRGVPVNVPALRRTARILAETRAQDGARFEELTGVRFTQRARVLRWLQTEGGFPFKNLQAVTMDDAEASLDDWCGHAKAREVFNLYRGLSFSAASKIDTMLACVCRDGTIKGTLQFHGASTGRWSGRLIQPQNFKRTTHTGAEDAYKAICDGVISTAEELKLVYGAPMDVISSAVRFYIKCTDTDIFDADYASVEFRIVCWLAGQLDALREIREGKDMYVKMASVIFGITEKLVSKLQRWMGKQTVLGCGFQMGKDKFYDQCVTLAKKFKIEGLSVTKDLAEDSVNAFRGLFDKVAALWNIVDNAARKAIRNPGVIVPAGRYLSFRMVRVSGIAFLTMRLPSGRNLYYPRPALEHIKGRSRGGRPSITFYGQIKGEQWGRVATYGGKLVENATQATAADVMMNGTDEALARGHDVLMLVHDEGLAAALPDLTVEDFADALASLPEWAGGLPIAVEGEVIPYYKKI